MTNLLAIHHKEEEFLNDLITLSHVRDLESMKSEMSIPALKEAEVNFTWEEELPDWGGRRHLNYYGFHMLPL